VVGLTLSPKITSLAKTPFEIPLFHSYMPWAIGASAIALIGGVAGIWAARKRNVELAVVLIGAAGFLCSQSLMLGHEQFGRYIAGVDYVPVLAAELTPDTPIYSVGRYEQALPFYLRRTIILVEHADEMEFGVTQEPHLWIPTLGAFLEKWNVDRANGKKAMAILRPDIFESLQHQGVPMRILVQDPRRVIVMNDASK
jgi:hypothetical protein